MRRDVGAGPSGPAPNDEGSRSVVDRLPEHRSGSPCRGPPASRRRLLPGPGPGRAQLTLKVMTLCTQTPMGLSRFIAGLNSICMATFRAAVSKAS